MDGRTTPDGTYFLLSFYHVSHRTEAMIRFSHASDLITLYYCRTLYNVTPVVKVIVNGGGVLMVARVETNHRCFAAWDKHRLLKIDGLERRAESLVFAQLVIEHELIAKEQH